jgi:hypothetical protein
MRAAGRAITEEQLTPVLVAALSARAAELNPGS